MSLTSTYPQQAILETKRLTLRPFTQQDAEALVAVANDFSVADTTIAVAHPFDTAAAQAWLAPLQEYHLAGMRTTWAIVLKEGNTLIGMISLSTDDISHGIADLGYWLGSAHWNKGYATEAGQAVVKYAFERPEIQRLQSYHFTRNPASGHVLKKLGFQFEGTRRQGIRKWDKFEDIDLYGLLKSQRS